MFLVNGKLVAMLPANIADDTLCSHQGLTYGGLLIPDKHIDGSDVLNIFKALNIWCKAQGIRRISYKPVPWIFHRRPSQEDMYALYRLSARRTGCNLSSSIYLPNDFTFDMSKRQQVKKALRNAPVIAETDDFAPFWQLLSDCLRERHGAAPVHSLEEIQMLHSRFPHNIRLHTVSDSNGLQAGICIFDTGLVAHSQYTASTCEARKNYYVTLLYHHLLTEVYTHRRYFDFGTSNGDGGRFLDDGLLRQKFSMSGTGVTFETYEISTDETC